MLKRLYVNNYKCLVNFELSLARTTLLVGLNGTGKSTVFDLLEQLRSFVAGGTSVEESFPSRSLTHWQSSDLQRFELTVSGGPDGIPEDYYYLLELEHDRVRQRCRVRKERVRTSTAVLFQFDEGEVGLFRDDGSAGPKFPFDWSRSGLTTIMERHDNTRLSWFKRWLRDLHTVRLDPASMLSRGEREVSHPKMDLSNFACWYRHLMQERPREIGELFESLSQVLDGFSVLELVQDGEAARTLKVRFETLVQEGEPRKSFQLGFQELSDGQRALIALYTLLHTMRSQMTRTHLINRKVVTFAQDRRPLERLSGIYEIASTLCLDEPDNFVALAEIQPLVFEFCDATGEKDPQVIFASHHPEIIDHPGIKRRLLLHRDNGGPTRITPLQHGEQLGLAPSEMIARGWENDEATR